MGYEKGMRWTWRFSLGDTEGGEEEEDLFATDSEDDDGSGFEGSDLSEEVRRRGEQESRSDAGMGWDVCVVNYYYG